MTIRPLTGLITLILVVAFSSGCPRYEPSSSPPHITSAELSVPPVSEQELVVLCGTSFGPPLEKLAALFEEQAGTKVVISFGGSEDLLPQVKMKDPSVPLGVRVGQRSPEKWEDNSFLWVLDV